MGEEVKAKNGNRLTCAYALPRERGSRFSILDLHLWHFIRVGDRCLPLRATHTCCCDGVGKEPHFVGRTDGKVPGNMAKPKDFVGRSRSPQDRKGRKKVGHVKYLGIKPAE